MTKFEFLSKSENATFKFGESLGKAFCKPMVIFLSGTLGSGKTRLVKAIAAGLDIDPGHVQSPTFTLMTPHRGRLTLVHVDAYRIGDQDEADQLGLDDWIDAGCILVVEWAERITDRLPSPDIQILIEHVDAKTRRFAICAISDIANQALKQCLANQ